MFLWARLCVGHLSVVFKGDFVATVRDIQERNVSIWNVAGMFEGHCIWLQVVVL